MNWLKKRREQLGLTQEELAVQLQVEGLDVSRGAVSAWEVGRNNLPLDDANSRAIFSRVLKMDVRQILKLSGYEIAQSYHSEEAEKAAFIIDQLNPEEQKHALKILETFLDRGVQSA